MRPLSLPCFHAATAWGWHFWLFVAGSLVWGLAMYLLITLCARRGGWATAVAIAGVYLASAIPLAALALFVEQRSIRSLMNPIHGSVALVWLDPVILPILVGVCSFAWGHLPATSRWRQPWWLVLSGLVGVVGAVLFHAHAAGAYDLFQDHSPTNLFHDIAAYFALLAAGVYLTLPVLANPESVGLRLWWLAVILVAIAICLLWLEAVYHLAPGVYHADADWAHWGRAFSCMDADG